MSRLKPELNTQTQDNFTSFPKKKKRKKKINVPSVTFAQTSVTIVTNGINWTTDLNW